MTLYKRILIVDDVEDNLYLMQFSLEELGYEIDTATSVTEGLERIKDRFPSLVLLDYMMPDALGSELVTYIRQTKAIAKIPIIVITACVPLRGYSFDFGNVNAVFYKPFDIELLREQVQQLLWNPELVECSV